MKFEWEVIEYWNYGDGGIKTKRAKISNGWLVHSFTWGKTDSSQSMVFVSDHNHEWTIEK